MKNIQNESRIKKVVRQRCTLSPLLFNAYIQEAINTIRYRTQLGIKLNLHRINILKFADGIEILAVIEINFKIILETMKETIECVLNINMRARKTKFDLMIIVV